MKDSRTNLNKIKDICRDVPLTVFIAEPSTKRLITNQRADDTPGELTKRQNYLDLISGHDLPMTGLSAYIANLAQRHGISYVKTGSSALAEVITRLAGDDAKPDETERLVIALRRANIIDGPTMVTLLGRYFDENRNV